MIKQPMRVICCAGALALGACQSAATRVYSLDVAAPAVGQTTYQAPALRVDSLSVPAGWDRIEILQPLAAGRVEISDFDHWSAPLAQVARQTLSADLSERLPSGSVIYPRLPKPSGALGVNVDILEFSVTGAHASMQASWVITPPAGRSAERSEALLHGSMSSTEPAAVVRLWSELLGQLADRIAADAARY
jgi:uncharacterized lipoprotein YmbA